jgi:Uncharacterised nucleotidyltransferase
VTAIAGRPPTCLDFRPRDDREMHLLLDCARASLEPERADRINKVVTDGVDWHRLLKLARRNGLAPLLFFHLNKICAANVPTGTFEVLRDYYQKNCAFNLLLTGELVRLLKALNDNGVDAIPYKGPAIAAKLYGHVALRQFCDLDILVRGGDIWTVSRLMEAQGFAPQSIIPEKKRAAFVRQDYVRSFHRDNGRTLVEVHWGIAPRYFAVPFDAKALWPRLEPMSLQGATVYMPCAEDLLLMLCVHGTRHGWDKLEGICAIAALIGRTPRLDWEDVWRRSREMHCRRILGLALLLAHGLFQVPLPPEAVAMSRSRSLLTLAGNIVRNCCSDEGPRPSARLMALHLLLKDSFTDQLRHCVGLVSTPNPNDWNTNRLRGPVSFAYPFVRALRLARKYGPLTNSPTGGRLADSRRHS